MNAAAQKYRKPTPAQIARREKSMRAQDARVNKANIANHEKLARAIVEAVKLDPTIQFDIVVDWLHRNGYVLVSKAEDEARARRLLARERLLKELDAKYPAPRARKASNQ